jgi:hypothetical protein
VLRVIEDDRLAAVPVTVYVELERCDLGSLLVVNLVASYIGLHRFGFCHSGPADYPDERITARHEITLVTP